MKATAFLWEVLDILKINVGIGFTSLEINRFYEELVVNECSEDVIDILQQVLNSWVALVRLAI